MLGTSPRTRGKPLASDSLIPRPQEHPRARGENKVQVVRRHAERGTSPRTRGKQTPSRVRERQQRNIPAHAGKTLAQGAGMISVGEHPRARGENTAQCPPALAEKGTSPRTRGKQLVGGERRNRGGTSPRTRGKPPICSRVNGLVRNIPAHAGKTAGLSFFSSSSAEHPRARGENHRMVWTVDDLLGTSPRTRGKQPPTPHTPSPTGNIPAHAGKTNCAQVASVGCKEHPRARGENLLGLFRKPTTRGTSPRTRGKRIHQAHSVPPKRNILAHAGKTNISHFEQ